MKISRRTLISGLAATAAASGTIAARAADPCSVPQKWDQTWDVIVVGGGGAGLTAGIFAKESGAKTIVLEKMAFPGGNTMISGGGLNAAVEEDARAIGVTDSPELHARQTLDAGDFRADAQVVGTLTRGAPETVSWLKKIGVQFNPKVYQIYGGLYPRCHNPVGQSGGDYIKAEVEYARKIGLEILTGHKVTAFIREAPLSGRVLGVEVEIAGKKQYWRALRGVVAAAGGFSANGKMCSYYDPRLETLNTTNQPGATGEVLLALQDIGALTVGLDYVQCVPGSAPGYNHYADVFQDVSYCIFVNKEGRRFVAEDERRDIIRDAALAQTDLIFYQVCDYYGFVENNKFYGDRNRIALKNGTLFEASTIEELAEKIKVPATDLKASIESFNASVESKKDEFGRKAQTLTSKIATAPFYGGPTGMCRHHTCGGAKIDSRARVVDRHGEVIPGLYAAGEVSGGVHGTNRVGGNAVCECLTFGRIAGQNAAKG